MQRSRKGEFRKDISIGIYLSIFYNENQKENIGQNRIEQANGYILNGKISNIRTWIKKY